MNWFQAFLSFLNAPLGRLRLPLFHSNQPRPSVVAVAWLFAVIGFSLSSQASFAQGYINPPLWAKGVVLVQPGTTVTTTLVALLFIARTCL